MTDRELLELAAKAAGWTLVWKSLGGEMPNPFMFNESDATSGAWNPLTDDGDALRLAVKLELEIFFTSQNIRATNRHIDQVPAENKGSDPYAATRRAIVRAAAEIGKGQA